jgi:hypothetical protein
MGIYQGTYGYLGYISGIEDLELSHSFMEIGVNMNTWNTYDEMVLST